MDPSFWGKAAWQYFHTLTFNYPTNPTKDDKLKYLKTNIKIVISKFLLNIKKKFVLAIFF